MNGLGNNILVVDMRGRPDAVTPAAAIALAASEPTAFDQIMAIHDPRLNGTFAYIDIINSDGSKAQACGNGMRCVVQALSAETGEQVFTFQTVAGILNAREHADGMVTVDMGELPANLQGIKLCRRMYRIDDKVNNAYKGWPDRLYLVGKDGKIAYAGGQGPFGFHPDELAEAIVEALKPPAK